MFFIGNTVALCIDACISSGVTHIFPSHLIMLAVKGATKGAKGAEAPPPPPPPT